LEVRKIGIPLHLYSIELLGKAIAHQGDCLFLIRPTGDNTPANALDALNMVSLSRVYVILFLLVSLSQTKLHNPAILAVLSTVAVVIRETKG